MGRARKGKSCSERFDPARAGGCPHGSSQLVSGDLSYLFFQDFIAAVDLKFSDRQTFSNANFADAVGKAAADAKAKHPALMKDQAQRKLVRARLLAMSTNAVLARGGVVSEACAIAFMTAAMAVTNIAFDEDESFGNGQPIMMCGERDLVKFLHRRIPCGCLEARHKQLRKQPSLAPCFHCGTFKERKQLFVCSRCKTPNYCSREST